MAERIMITPQELNDGATYLRQRLEAINDEVGQIQTQIKDISSRWEGAAQQSFITQFESQMYPILHETMPQVIEGMAQELDAAANAMRETDASLASAFSG